MLQSMLVTDESEIQNFCDAVAAVLVDNKVSQRDFSREQLRLCLVELGLIGPNQLIREVALPQSLSGDSRFAWDADGKHVTVTI